MGQCSRRGSLKAAFPWWYQDARGLSHPAVFDWIAQRANARLRAMARMNFRSLEQRPTSGAQKPVFSCPLTLWFAIFLSPAVWSAEPGVTGSKVWAAAETEWSLQPVTRPRLPSTQAGGRNAIDAFIVAKLAEN